MIPSKLVQIFIVSSVIFPILSVIIRYLQHDLIIDSKNSFDSFMFNSDKARDSSRLYLPMPLPDPKP